MTRVAGWFAVLGILLGACGCTPLGREQPARSPDLAGAWRSAVQFRSGAFASITDLEFLYAFNGGGTMTESSNYDGAPPVPPAYGVWRKTGLNEFEAHYEFYATKPPTQPSELVNGFLPAGRGVLIEKLTLAADGQSFTSTIRYDAFDVAGKPAPGGGEATGKGMRISFEAEGDSTDSVPAHPAAK